MATVTLSNLQIDENPKRIGGSPNVISMSVDVIINTNDMNDQQFFYEVRNSQNEILAMQIHPQDHKIKPNTKKTVYIPQVFRTADGNYILNAWSVSTWTGRRFDWGSHTGIKEWERSSNVASISKKVSRTELVVDPSTSAGYRTNTLKYGYEEPEPQVEKDCPVYCDIVYVPTNTVAYSGLCSCSMLENYKSDPDYRIDQISKRETKPDYRGTQPEPDKLYTVHGQTIPLSQTAVDYYESLGVPVTTAEIDPYVPPTEKPFEKPDYRGTQPEPEVTTDHIQPPSEDQDFLPPTSQVEPPIAEPEPQVTTSQVEPAGVEEPQVTTSQVEPQEVTAQISWFGNTWFPWHLELEDRRRR